MRKKLQFFFLAIIYVTCLVKPALACFFFHDILCVGHSNCPPTDINEFLWQKFSIVLCVKVMPCTVQKCTSSCVPVTTGIQWTISTYQQALWDFLQCGSEYTRRCSHIASKRYYGTQQLSNILLAPDKKFTDCSTWCSDDCLNHFNLISLAVLFSLQMHLKLFNVEQFACIQCQSLCETSVELWMWIDTC